MTHLPAPGADRLAQFMSLRDLLRYAISRFNAAGLFFGHGTDNAWDEAVYLLTWALHLPADRLEPFLDARLLETERAQVLDLIDRRVDGRLPAPYLTHEAWLTGHRFYVDERVIVPRSFIAELLEEDLTPWVDDPWAIGRVLDLCTGSGCLAILAALTFPEAEVDAVDISPAALEVASRNVQDYDLKERVHLVQSNLLSGLDDRRYDIIISNPPYVKAASMQSLPPEYQVEPVLALAGGDDGLDLVRTIIGHAAAHLNPRGLLVCEIGHNRDALEAAYPDLPFVWLETSSGNEFVFLLHAEDL